MLLPFVAQEHGRGIATGHAIEDIGVETGALEVLHFLGVVFGRALHVQFVELGLDGP